MESYNTLAECYDDFTEDVKYIKWADYLTSLFEKYGDGGEMKEILDLACGTGSLSLILAERGYEVIGTDASEEMLAVAQEKAFELPENRPMFLCQRMEKLDLYGTVDAAVSCLDSLNYLLGEDELGKVFSLVHNYSDPDALFMFDMNTPYKFENIYSDNAYILEDEGIFCGWQNFYDKKSEICDFYLSVFKEDEGGAYIREDEHQRERCYALDTVKRLLVEHGFELVGVYSDFDFGEICENTERWYFVARAKK